ncbi:carbonic anhydrase [Methyloceanibacter marginalis]|jgi:carbonic anhydrase|nr:carbonic anhydrase [Methyloceanibacter marginalis]
MLPKPLIDGYWRFRKDSHGPDKGRYRQLATLGQSPTGMVIACCDSRVDVSAIFDAGPGVLFIMRNVANLVPPFEPEGKFHGTSAAVEYAALVLNVPNIIVLGHSHCGGIAAYREKLAGKADETSFIGRWLTLLDGINVKANEVDAFGPEVASELAGIRQSLANLRTFDALKKREAEGLLTLHGLHFDIGSGTVLALDEKTDSFAPLPEDD